MSEFDRSVPAVEITGISKTYGATRALVDVDVTIAAGEVHGLIGRNGAGKSTLVRCLTGLERPDSGSIRLFGHPAPATSAPAEWKKVVDAVQQRPPLVDSMTVAENIFLNRYPRNSGRVISWRRTRRAAQDLLDEWGISEDPGRLVRDVAIESRAMIQIARVLNAGARVVLLDEPTVQLDGHATTRLFDRVRELKSRGVTFVLVSHFLQEIEQVCDTATVLRDGRLLWSKPVRELGQNDLVDAILAGSESRAERLRGAPSAPAAPVALAVRGLTDPYGSYQDLNLSLAPGELLGIAGLGGSGKNELGEALGGLRSVGSGEVEVGGRRLRTGSPARSQAAGIGFVPGDRHRDGFVPKMSVEENMTMAITTTMTRAGIISRRRRRSRAVDLITEVSLVPPRVDLDVDGLSGGNQQKVVFARAIASDPTVLVLVSPTAGVDISAKDVLYDLIRNALGRGIAVVLISDDVDEVLLSPRVLVMYRGRVIRELLEPTEADVVHAMEGPGNEIENGER